MRASVPHMVCQAKVWAVGRSGLVLRRSGGQWIDVPQTVIAGDLLAVWVGTFVLLRINPRDDDDGQQR